MPALLKGYIDRVFLPGFAMQYHDAFPYVEKLLQGRSARVIYTQNGPQFLARIARGDLFWTVMKKAILRHCGSSPVKRTVCGPVMKSNRHERAKWLKKVFQLGRLGK
jgi:putative NADPH-quinone reductase